MNTKKNEKGFSLVELLVVVIIIAIVAAIAIPNLLASRRAANEASAISTLRTYHSAEATYQATLGQSTSYGNETDLVGLVDAVLATDAPSKSGYDFEVTIGGANDSLYCASAEPSSSATGTRHFAVSVDGVIYNRDTVFTCAAGAIDSLAGATPIQ
jgi:prepilin-type N-terminal cleavage/methylation domain-containing protein